MIHIHTLGRTRFHRYGIQNVKDGIKIQVYNINNESVSHISQFISVKVQKNLRQSQAQFRGKLGKSRLRKNDGFLIKKTRLYFGLMLKTEIGSRLKIA